jgi:pimeloyl-ACP methyl ester carboxylesterase
VPGTTIVTLADGREVAVHQTTAALDDARTIVLCHPAPGSGCLDPDPARTTARSVRLLSADRPGYGGSSPLPAGTWSTPDQAAADLEAVLDEMGVPTAGVVGWGVGGLVALALAALRPDLVDRLVLVATPRLGEPVSWPGVPATILDGLDADDADTAQAILTERLAPVVPEDPASDTALDLLGRSDADSAALAMPGARDRLAGMLTAAFAQGLAGLTADLAGHHLRDPGFTPDQVTAKTLLIYGNKDPVTPHRHGTWWQRNLPQARIEISPDHGHLLLIPKWERVLSHLAPGSKTQR